MRRETRVSASSAAITIQSNFDDNVGIVHFAPKRRPVIIKLIHQASISLFARRVSGILLTRWGYFLGFI